MTLTLAQALRVDTSPCIAFIGAGGKTTAMLQLARQLPAPVIVTATSHLGTWQTRLADHHIITETPAPIEELEHGLSGVILITGQIDGDRTQPIDHGLLLWLHQFCDYHSIPLLIEADGSRQKPLKAWAEHEPPIPAFAKAVVQVVGLSAIGKTLEHEFVHRPEVFSKITGLPVGEKITASAVAHMLTHPESGLKNAPEEAERIILLNQADTPDHQATAHGMADALLTKYERVVIASLLKKNIYAVHEPIAGVILAAGESARYGQPKQLLDWHGQPFIRAVAKTALEAGLSPVVIVIGANAEKIQAAVQGLDVRIVFNEDWKSGQGSSIKAGISILHPHPQNKEDGVKAKKVGGAVFLLADQPQITISILRALVEKHAERLHPIVAPMVMDRRANPVLFDRVTFQDLLSIEGDVGGRAIFHKHRVEYLPWHDDRLLLDVDTPEMYQRLIDDETL